jgi:hypothetical protein
VDSYAQQVRIAPGPPVESPTLSTGIATVANPHHIARQLYQRRHTRSGATYR